MSKGELVTKYIVPLEDTQRPGERQNVLIEVGAKFIRIAFEGENREIFVERVGGVIEGIYRPLDWATDPNYQPALMPKVT